MFAEKNRRVFIRWWRTAAARTQRKPLINLKVGAEENPILMFDENAADLFGLMATDLRNARRDIGHHIWETIKLAVHPIEVFGIVGKVDANKGRFRMSRNDAAQRIQQFIMRWVNFRIAKPPLPMVLEFFPSPAAARWWLPAADR